MTTGHKLLLKLTNGQRKKFILNIIRIHGTEKSKLILERKYQGVHSLMNGAFAWINSAEGMEYWTKAYQNVI